MCFRFSRDRCDEDEPPWGKIKRRRPFCGVLVRLTLIGLGRCSVHNACACACTKQAEDGDGCLIAVGGVSIIRNACIVVGIIAILQVSRNANSSGTH